MKNIFKIFLLMIAPLLLLTACRDEVDRDWTTPEPTFTLYETSLGAMVLYPTMDQNPFLLKWSNSGGSGPYSVVISTSEDFKSKVELSKSETNALSTTIGALNSAMLQAGLQPYTSKTVYIRVERGTEVSNAISFPLTTYPVAKPVITSPAAGAFVALDAENPLVTAMTATWTDYDYGVSVQYLVEIAPSGTTDFQSVGTVKDSTALAISNFTLNEAALKTGLAAGIASNVDIRVTVTSVSVGGTIMKVSDVVTFKLTPYQPAYIPFYLVGGGTAVGWDASKAQLLYQQENVSEIYTYLENGGLFRFLGQQDWAPLNYSLNADGMKEDYRYFNTWSDNLTVDGDENIKFTGNSGMYKITIDQNARAISVTPSPIPTLPTNVYIVGSLNDWSAENALPMEQIGDGLFEYTIAIPDGAQFKFIGQKAWGDLEWGNIHRAGNSGFVGPKGDNDNIQYNGGGAVYKITLNVKLGIYKVTPQ